MFKLEMSTFKTKDFYFETKKSSLLKQKIYTFKLKIDIFKTGQFFHFYLKLEILTFKLEISTFITRNFYF